MAVIDVAVIRNLPTSGESIGLILPVGKRVGPLILNFVSLIVLSVCGTRRVQNIRRWRSLPLSYWLLLLVYADTLVFILSTALLNSIGINSSYEVCQTGIFLCLIFYFVSKIMIYLFLVEKAHIVRGRGKRRLKSKVYWFNCFGMLLPYAGIGVANIVRRIGYIRKDGMCIIGMERDAILPLGIFEVIVNLYLTTTFLIPIRNLHSYNHNPRLKKMVFRTFIGSLATLTSTVTNVIVMIVLNGEPAWMCFMICDVDLLFTTLVLHWVTVADPVGNSGCESARQPSLGHGGHVTNTNTNIKPATLKRAATSRTTHQHAREVQPATGELKDDSELELVGVDEENCHTKRAHTG